MKKTISLLSLLFFAISLCAEPFGILVNGTSFYAASALSEMDYQGRNQYKTSVYLEVGDVVCILDQGTNVQFMATMESGDGSAKSNFTETSSNATCKVAGCYDFYIKLKWEDNLIWVQAGSGCSGTGDGGDCDDGPYGIIVNDEDVYEANATGEEDYEGRVQYLANVQLKAGDSFVIVNRSCDARWSEDVESYGEGANFSGGKAAGKVTCDVAGCYAIYIKMKMDDNILYIGAAEDCDDAIDKNDTIVEREKYAKSVPERCPDVMLQAFYYDSYGDNGPGNVTINGKKLGDTKWSTLLDNSEDIGRYFDMVWLPPSGKSTGGTGYLQTQYSNQNSDWGSKVELVEFIDRMHKADTKVIADIVINHAGNKSSWCDFYTQYFTPYGTFTPQPSWICSTDEVKYQTEDAACAAGATGVDDGGYNGQDNYPDARDWAHANGQVQAMMKAYLRFMKNVIGFDGWRYDYAQGFKGKYINMYNSASANYFSVCEFWNGDIANIKGYLNDCSWNTTVFDFSDKMNGVKAIADGNWTACKSSGLSGTGDGRYAVTFVDNHDTYFGCKGGRESQDEFAGCGNSMQTYNKYRVLGANAYILSRPGIPCVFWPHWVAYKSDIKKMVMARKLAGVHSESNLSEDAGNGKYIATVTGTNGSIILKMGPNSNYGDTPSGYTLVYKSTDNSCPFAMYYKTNSAEKPRLSITPSQTFRTAPFSITMTADALTGTPAIYYTTDGSTPTTSSTRYTSAVTITGTTTVKAIAVLNGQSSAVMEETYTYKEPQTTPILLRFAPDKTWTGGVYVHIWDVEGGSINTGAWPGKALTIGADGWYSYQCPAGVKSLKFIFNNGNNGLQTGDLQTDEDVCYLWKNGCEELDDNCAAASISFSVVVGPESMIFRDNSQGIDVTITAVGAPEGTTPTIYYTTDGTNPTTSSQSSTANPLVLNFKQTTELRAMAVAGSKKTEVVTNVYTYKAPQSTPFNVKFYNTESWKKVNIYTWSATESGVEFTGAWPGTAITDDNKDGWYEYTFEQVMPSVWVIFNNGSNSQTQDILVDEDACYVWMKDDKIAAYSATCDPNDTPIEVVREDEQIVPELDLNAPMYNILGQPVDKNYKGIVIQAGNKYLRF